MSADEPHPQSRTIRPTTRYVDWDQLESKLTADRAARLSTHDEPEPASRHRPRLISSVDAEADHLRANVRDSAKAVLTWLSAVTEQRDQSLDDVLDRCLKPGPDVERLNYEALAREIQQTVQADVTPKRVRTAIAHLRHSHEQKVGRMQQQQSMRQRLDALGQSLRDQYTALIESEQQDQSSPRRQVAADVLAAVRCAAGRLIEKDFGEGIPQSIDVDQLQDRFLEFVRDVMRQGPPPADGPTLADDLHRLLVTLTDYDRSAQYDMQVVVDGSRVVAELVGPDSLMGLLAQLNVLMAGRSMLDSQVFCEQMFRLANDAGDLHDDPQTKSLLNWLRRLPEDQRLPSPLRVCSYCLNNAATHILVRIFKDELPAHGPEQWLDRATEAIERMRQRDSGFALIKTSQLVELSVAAKLSGDAGAIEAHFKSLGRAESLRRLEDLARYESCIEVVQAAQAHAIAAIPALKHQLIRVG